MKDNVNRKVIAIVSGGPDSFCSLVMFLAKGFNAEVFHFNYGHKASRKETEVIKKLIDKLNILAKERGWGVVEKLHIIDMGFMKSFWKNTQLVDESVTVEEEYKPSVVVPLRNVVMVVIAAAYAYTLIEKEGLDVILVLGSQYDDVKPTEDWGPRYPDCSPECFIALESAFNICHFRKCIGKLKIWTPSKEMIRKSELLRRCYSFIGDLIYETWSCYQGYEKHCGKCESCINRKRAFREAGLEDKTEYLV